MLMHNHYVKIVTSPDLLIFTEIAPIHEKKDLLIGQ